MNRRDFIKTGLAFCGCVYLGVDIVKGDDVVTWGDVTIEYPTDSRFGVIVNANGNSMERVYEVTRKLFMS